jgi:hypothetical protein
MLCPKCGTENTDQAEFCVNCNENLVIEEHSAPQENTDEMPATSTTNGQAVKTKDKQAPEPKHHQRITDIDLKPDASDKPVVSRGFNIAIIIATLILPIIGVIVGFTYLRKENPEAQKAGKTWLILGGIMIVVNIILIKGM